MNAIAAFVLALLLSCAAVPAAAQGVAVLNPIARSYTALGFVYTAPAGDGWREIESSPEGFRIVYAEQLGEQINTRADFQAHAFLIPEPDQLPDPFTLTRMSMSQRVEEKGETLVAMAHVQPVEGKVPVHEYTLVVKIGDQDYFEHHFVAVAPDKSQYLAAKLMTQDKDFRQAPYFAPLSQAMASLEFPGAAAESKADGKETSETPPAGQADPSASSD